MAKPSRILKYLFLNLFINSIYNISDKKRKYNKITLCSICFGLFIIEIIWLFLFCCNDIPCNPFILYLRWCIWIIIRSLKFIKLYTLNYFSVKNDLLLMLNGILHFVDIHFWIQIYLYLLAISKKANVNSYYHLF
jgi:hypothetical protein